MLDRIVNVENITLGKAKMTDGQTQLSITSSAITYRFVENPPTPSKKGKKR